MFLLAVIYGDIQTTLKPLKKSGKIEINLYDHFWTSSIIENDEPAWPHRARSDRNPL